MAHYLELHLTEGEGFVRKYFPLAHPEETEAEAIGRWIEAQVKGRKRNVDRARDQARARIELALIHHPTSWYRENELGVFAPPGLKGRRMRRR